MRRCIPLLLLLALAASGCGSDEENPALLTQSRADELTEDLQQLRVAVAAGECERVEGELRQLRSTVAALPERTSVRLRTRIEQGVAELASVAAEECAQAEEEQEEPQTTETEPAETTETQPTETTETLPPETAPAEPTQPPPATEPAPAPPAEDPGGEEPGGGLEAPQGVVVPGPAGEGDDG